MDAFSLLLLERDIYHDVQVSWMYPSCSAEDQERLIKSSNSRQALVGSSHDFYTLKHENSYFSCYRVSVNQIESEIAVQEATLVCISSKSTPRRDEALCKGLLNAYLTSKGNATAMLQLVLKTLATGKCGNINLLGIVEQ
jgi:hypothetical protein